MRPFKTILAICSTLLVVAATEPKPCAQALEPKKGQLVQVRFRFNKNWVSSDRLDNMARECLKAKGVPPPLHVKAVFDLFPRKGVFVRVWYPQSIGKPAWYVYFDGDGQVVEQGSTTTKG